MLERQVAHAVVRRAGQVEVELQHEGDGDPVRMRCQRCGTEAPFDLTLPYVNQVASFITGHNCVVVLPNDDA